MAGAYPEKIGGVCSTVDTHYRAHGTLLFVTLYDTVKRLITSMLDRLYLLNVHYLFLENHLSTSFGAHKNTGNELFSPNLRS